MSENTTAIILGLAFFTIVAFMVLQSRQNQCQAAVYYLNPLRVEQEHGIITRLGGNSLSTQERTG
jgi:hypothetical protein